MPLNTKEYHLLDKLLIQLYKRSYLIERYRFNCGAIVLDKNMNILSFGFNSYTKTHPLMLNNGYKEKQVFLHAEVDALNKSRIKGKPYAVMVARIGKTGDVKLAKPCKGCHNVLINSGIEKIFFTNNFGELVLDKEESEL